MTKAYNKFFINGEWVEPAGRSSLDVINPATEEAFATISMGTSEDVDAAAKAARAAFPVEHRRTQGSHREYYRRHEGSRRRDRYCHIE